MVRQSVEGKFTNTRELVWIEADTAVHFEKTDDRAQLPAKNHSTDTGFDVFSIEDVTVPARGSVIVQTGLKFAYITAGYWVKVEGRSGLGWKHGIIPQPGIIDQTYRGDASIKLYNSTDVDYHVRAGDRIAQFVVYRNYNVLVGFGKADQTDRGEKGFGSSGK